MEAVALHARVEQFARHRDAALAVALALVEGGVERGDLRQMRPDPADRLDQADGARLVQRGEGAERGDRLQHLSIDPRGALEPIAAMHDAVPGADEARRLVSLRQDRQRLRNDVVQILLQFGGKGQVGLVVAFLEVQHQRLVPEVDHPAADPRRGGAGGDLEQAEFDRRRAWVERQQQFLRHSGASLSWRSAPISLASAAEARRAFSESARLVRMTGTRAPRTSPAASAPAR